MRAGGALPEVSSAAMEQYAVYIMASLSRVIYIGVTADLERRVQEHKAHIDPHSFTAQYRCERLVYVELYSRVEDAISREKQLKGWRRSKKVALIQRMNPHWTDLAAPPAHTGPSTPLGMT